MFQVRTILTRTAQGGLVDLSQVANSQVFKTKLNYVSHSGPYGVENEVSLVPWSFDECAEFEESPSCGRLNAYVYVVQIIVRPARVWETFSVHKTRDEADQAREVMLATAQAQARADSSFACPKCGHPVACPCEGVRT